MANITSIKAQINQMGDAEFQTLCDAYLSKIGYSNIVCLGTMGGARKTTKGTPDTYFVVDGNKYVFVEYTTNTTNLIKKVSEDIEKCLDESKTRVPIQNITEIVYCHTSSNIAPGQDLKLKKMCSDVGIKLTLIGIDRLADDLQKYPSIIRDYLHLPIGTDQIQSIDDFIMQYDSNALAATLDTIFISREQELQSISESFADTDVVILSGPAGVGKSRIAIEYARKRGTDLGETLYCIHNRALPIYEDIRLFFEKPGAYFIVVDDANQLSELQYIIEYTNKKAEGYQVKVLLTVRDYAVNKVKADITGIVRYKEVCIKRLSDDTIINIVQRHYGITNRFYLDRITVIAEGNARIAMIAGKTAVDSNRLDSISDVTQLYSDYYGRVIREAKLDQNRALLISAGIIAFLDAIQLDYVDSIVPVLDQLGITKDTFVESLYTLHDFEIVDIYYDKAVQFSEQCLSNFLLKYVFYDTKEISISAMIEACFGPYRDRTMHAINTFLRVFQNEDLYKYTEEEIRKLWKKFSDSKAPCFFDYVKAFYPVNQIETLILLKNRIEETRVVEMPPEEINTKEGKNYVSVTDDIISILGGFAERENVDASLDLFFEYYSKRPDLYIQFYHSAVLSFGIKKDSFRNEYQIQTEFLKKLIDKTESGDNRHVSLLFIDLAKHFLQLMFSPAETNRNDTGIVIHQISLRLSKGVHEYRFIIWNGLKQLLCNEIYENQILQVFEEYGRGIEECSYDVVSDDAPSIENMLGAFSSDSLSTCLAARHIKEIFDLISYSSDIVDLHLKSDKMKMFNLLYGPRWDEIESFDERKQEKVRRIEEAIRLADYSISLFSELISVYVDAIRLHRSDWELSEGINIAITVFSERKEIYEKIVRLLLNNDLIGGIDTGSIVRQLFSYSLAEDAFNLLSTSNSINRNIWEYAYYCELPESSVNEKELKRLYDFLEQNSDCHITSSAFRTLDFLEKFQSIDNEVFLKASRIILKKQSYSPYMVDIYFSLMFKEYCSGPEKVVSRYSDDISLLEEIYDFVSRNGDNVDYKGAFLHAICDADPSYIAHSIEMEISRRGMIHNSGERYRVFYNDADYVDKIDIIVNTAFEHVPLKAMNMPEIISWFTSVPEANADLIEKRDCWVNHYIEVFSSDADKMQGLFGALWKQPVGSWKNYIEVFIHHNKAFSSFEKIPLIPLSWSWSGSAVPMMASWKDFLENLLTLFSGIDFIEHKNHVAKKIELLEQEMRHQEVMEIIRG
ncbi:MAG: ATP-binding protein [Blautia sp.]|nr:ATP-binding protein [Blautia sp.]